ncbi:MAG TPA: hypothetical protein VM509_06135 [Planctomycetota bacterium]|nr:hypothetical protein [Planctomycetota bacterium]
MPRIERCDEADAWHHVMNRGLSHRPVFERSQDARYFLSTLARVVSRGLIELHAYCLLTTHFHLLVRCRSPHLSEAMCLCQAAYVQWFNRSRDRDGPLFKGRFRSRRIQSEAHWANVVRYIDANSEEARIVHDAQQYPFCSRFDYAELRGPPWLSRREIEREVCKREQASAYSPELYDSAWSRTPLQRELVERRIRRKRSACDSYELFDSSSKSIQDWMQQQSRIADGTSAGVPIASATTVTAQLDASELDEPAWRIQSGSRLRRGWPVLRAGVLRIAAGLRYREIALLLECSTSTAGNLIELHRELLDGDADYRRRIEDAVRAVHFARPVQTK